MRQKVCDITFFFSRRISHCLIVGVVRYQSCCGSNVYCEVLYEFACCLSNTETLRTFLDPMLTAHCNVSLFNF